jgi:vacuolar-type H+-ATPase catalytic subunit A/Vma1
VAEPINWKEITTAFKGRMIIGSYAVEDKIVRVKTTLGEKEAQIEGNSPVFVAWRLLRELAGQEKA